MSGALSGINVLDFSWALVGSQTTRQLADHGATVVRIESARHPDLTRLEVQVAASKPRSLDDKPWFAHLNTSKLGFRLNIRHPRARIVIDRLIKWADVVMENFTPGTLDRLGLSTAEFRRMRPDLIIARGSVYGQTGPMAKSWGIDGTGNALSSRLELTGWPDRGPVVPSSVPYGDLLLPYVLVSAIVAALDRRRRTGEGADIDGNMFEVAVQQKMAPAIVACQLEPQPRTRMGNRDPERVPQGVFPCRGEDRWVAISIGNDPQWHAFRQVLGDPEWCRDPELAFFSGRKTREEELERRIGEWTATQDAAAVMEACQSSGVPAGVLQDAADLVDRDPQLAVRGFLTPLEYGSLGVFGHQTHPYKLSKTPACLSSAPTLGQHTREVSLNILGISESEFEELTKDGVFD